MGHRLGTAADCAARCLSYGVRKWRDERCGWRVQFNHGHTLGIACLLAVAIGAGYDIWHLVYTSIVRLESPLYARLALAKIHDPNELGSRVVLEVAGALAGVVVGWKLFSSGSWENDPPSA
ncbi:hypothetical protein CKU38_03917 [Xanthomonas citri pv. fuscans]|nr:hypothetical protein CKU38_03917 [Xanthomonas citri pv. fuscans]